MIRIDLEKVKEIILCWDWKRAVIPKSYVKKLKYEGILKDNLNDYTYECDYVYVELDLKYLQNHYYFTGNDLEYYRANNIQYDSDITMYENILNYNIWDINIIYQNGKVLTLNLPIKTEGDAWSKNILEQHKEINNILKIRWATLGALQDIKRRKQKIKMKKEK